MVLTQSEQATFWQDHLEKYRASGLSRPAYCKEHGLKIHHLVYQLKQHKPGGKRPVAKGGAFAKAVAAKVPPAAPAKAGGARLVISSGVVLEFQPSTDPRWIARVLGELGGAT